MKRLLSCEFNMDTACVELKFANGSIDVYKRQFQGKIIVLESLTPVLPPKEKEQRKKEIERCLYEVFSKYGDRFPSVSYTHLKVLFSSFMIRAKFVMQTATSRSIRALAIQPAMKLLPVPTPPQSSRPTFFPRISGQ